MKIVKYIIISVFSILVLFFIYGEIFLPKTTMINGEEISLENPWRKPNENESFNHLIKRFNFADCENLFVKDVENGNFILACLKKDKKWDFYWATPKINDLMKLSDEIKEEIKPPQ